VEAERHSGDWFDIDTGITFLAEAAEMLDRVGDHRGADEYFARVLERAPDKSRGQSPWVLLVIPDPTGASADPGTSLGVRLRGLDAAMARTRLGIQEACAEGSLRNVGRENDWDQVDRLRRSQSGCRTDM
jgi:hypothetical protein